MTEGFWKADLNLHPLLPFLNRIYYRELDGDHEHIPLYGGTENSYDLLMEHHEREKKKEEEEARIWAAGAEERKKRNQEQKAEKKRRKAEREKEAAQASGSVQK